MTVIPILRRALISGAVLTVAIALVAGGIGYAVDGTRGLVSGLIGAAVAFVFLALTAVSIIVAGRVTHGDMLNPAYFGIVLGSLVLKFVVFFVLAFSLRAQEWIQPQVLFFTIVASVLGSLVVDVLAFSRSRVPYVSDVTLPGDTDGTRAP